MRGPADMINKYKDLHVRSRIVKALAFLYIDNHVQDMGERPGVLKLHSLHRCSTIKGSIRAHVQQRMATLYPDEQFGTAEGSLLPGMVKSVHEQKASDKPNMTDTVFLGKPATMDDVPHPDAAGLFRGVRPSIISADGSAENVFPQETILEHSLKNVSDMNVLMSNKFEEQFIPKYLPRAFPWALNLSLIHI